MTRPRRWRRSLQERLLALVVGSAAVVWLGMAALSWIDMREELDELLDAYLAQADALLVLPQSRALGHGHGNGNGNGNDAQDRAVVAPRLHRRAPRVAFQVFREGRLVLRSANAPATPMAAAGEAARSGYQTTVMEGRRWRIFAAHAAVHDVQVYVGEQPASRTEILGALLRSMLAPTALALPLLGLAVGWAVFQGLRPLKRPERALAARDPQALEPLPSDGAPAEMVAMIAALNGLFARIGGLLESERRFTADAAHELRTPIAAIRTQAQVALNETDDAQRRHALAATLQGCDCAARLVDQLDGQVRLAVEDSGPGMYAVDLQRLGQRFFRVAGSGETGSGLGWPIVRRIAAVHGMTIEAGRSAELGGSRVEVCAPTRHA